MMDKLQETCRGQPKAVGLLTSNQTNPLQNTACFYHEKLVSAVQNYYPRHYFAALPIIWLHTSGFSGGTTF
jgi:hypothetical protein